MNRLQILILTQYFWPEPFRINEVAESLCELGCDVTILTGQPNYPDGKIYVGYSAWQTGRHRHHGGFDIHRTPIIPRGRGSGARLAANYLSFVLSASIVGPWLLRGKSFDVVFVYGISPILQGVPAAVFRELKRAASVIWVQDLWPQSLEVTGYVRSPRLLSTVGLLTKWIYRRADLLLVQSEAFLDEVRSMAGPAKSIAFHPNPGDRALAQSSAGDVCVSAPLQLPAGFNVVFAGNLGSAQGLETIVAAAAILLKQHSDINIVVIGSGSKLAWLQAEVKRRGLHNFYITGRVSPEAMPAIFRQASVLLATLSNAPILSQTIPSKIPSYLASERPIIACMNGEGARIVREAGAGLTVPASDAESLAAAMVALRNMPLEVLNAMAASGRAYFDEHFSPRKLANKLIRHFEAAIRNRRNPRSDGDDSGV